MCCKCGNTGNLIKDRKNRFWCHECLKDLASAAPVIEYRLKMFNDTLDIPNKKGQIFSVGDTGTCLVEDGHSSRWTEGYLTPIDFFKMLKDHLKEDLAQLQEKEEAEEKDESFIAF